MLYTCTRRCCSAFLAMCVLLLAGWGTIAAQPASPDSTPIASGIEGAVAWLVAQQSDDGAFPGFTGEPDAGVTVDAIIALAAARDDGVGSGEVIDNALAYLASGDIALVYVQTGVGQAAKLILALAAAGENPLDFANVQPLTIIDNGLDSETHIYGTGMYDHALAVLALVATGSEVPQAALDTITATQADHGGWAFDASTDPAMADSNTTALVLQALVSAGSGDSDLVTSGLAYLESTWTGGGAAWNHLEGAAPDTNSTAVVLQALIAAGQDVSDRIAALETFQNPGGAFFFNAEDTSDNLFATLQAIPALAEEPLPIGASGQEAARDTLAA